jgi:hypothetical protein
MKLLNCLLLLIFLAFGAYCQQPDTTKSRPQVPLANSVNGAPGQPSNNQPTKEISGETIGFLSQLEFTLSMSVLGFGLLLIVFEIYLVKTNKLPSEQIVKFIIVTLIIVSTLFLITAGYSNNQIAPATGLLGTIAGYLLGKTSTTPSDSK